MMLLLLISIGVTVFLIAAAVLVLVSRDESVDARLMEVSAPQYSDVVLVDGPPKNGLASVAAGLADTLKPVSQLLFNSDEDLGYRLALAGFRKADHIQIYTALRMLLPVVGIVAGTFYSSNIILGMIVGAILGFFSPDLILSNLVSRRQRSISQALPDALDLLVICMEAGLGIDQAMGRVGEEMRLTSPPLADELQIIIREQRAGKPRVEAWRSMAERVDIDFIRQFVSMLVQTERFGTPIAQALSQFADMMRERRTQAAEEMAAKTGVKLLFPLVLFIFPSIFVVSLGPAILGIQKLFQDLAK